MWKIGSSRILLTLLVVVGTLLFNQASYSQTEPEKTKEDEEVCKQGKKVRDPLIEEAERDQFNVRRVEIVGSTYNRDREFRRRMFMTNEGDIFTRRNLEKAVKRISKMNTIFPIMMENVEVRLDRTYMEIDIVFCVKQKPKR